MPCLLNAIALLAYTLNFMLIIVLNHSLLLLQTPRYTYITYALLYSKAFVLLLFIFVKTTPTELTPLIYPPTMFGLKKWVQLLLT
jgi:hypothetical protein